MPIIDVRTIVEERSRTSTKAGSVRRDNLHATQPAWLFPCRPIEPDRSWGRRPMLIVDGPDHSLGIANPVANMLEASQTPPRAVVEHNNYGLLSQADLPSSSGPHNPNKYPSEPSL